MFQKDALRKFVDLFLISFLALYFEVLFIRWIPSSVQIIAYFANVILISAFLGLGLGCLLAQRKYDFMRLFLTIMLCMVALLAILNKAMVKATFIQGELLLGFYGVEGGVNALLLIIVIFILNALMFVPLGQRLGISLKYFKPLVAYSINIAGSISGVVIFSLLSYLMLGPVHWFLFGLLISLWFYLGQKRPVFYQLLTIVIGVAIIWVVSIINPLSHWSPYYKIEIKPQISHISGKQIGYNISANNMHHQYAFNLSESGLGVSPELRLYKNIYEFPYNFIKANRVLILGAGSGNDASAALRMKAGDISAVEIDPLIASLGRTLHEEMPYKAKNVKLFIDDARSFIKRTDKKFDLITFGYLDAHKVLSQFSSVRLDSFIYTEESFRDMKQHLNPEGFISLTYLVFREWVGSKLYATMYKVFGEDLKVVRTSTYIPNDTAIYLAGPGVKNIRDIKDNRFKFYEGFNKSAQSITDDWPYLYLAKKEMPAHYLIILLCVFIISVISILAVKSSLLVDFSPHFFFLGAGFMLLEAVSITRFALLFGATWMVNSAVIISILVMALLANLYAGKVRKIDPRLWYMLLAGAILLNWLLKPDFYLSFNRTAGIALSSFVLSLPLLFAGIIFANSFKNVKDVSLVFACNLLGAIVGGLCEYISLGTGFRFLFIVAALMYFLSYVGLKKQRA